MRSSDFLDLITGGSLGYLLGLVLTTRWETRSARRQARALGIIVDHHGEAPKAPTTGTADE